MFAIWWLTYLARVGLSPTGIIDLARTHTPFILTPFILEHHRNPANKDKGNMILE
jgi:hypothetical protein